MNFGIFTYFNSMRRFVRETQLRKFSNSVGCVVALEMGANLLVTSPLGARMSAFWVAAMIFGSRQRIHR